MQLNIIIAMVLSYLVGSISSAIIISKIMRLPDPRLQGSKNPGATNVLRLGGKKAAILTLLGDVLKGVIPVLLGKLYGLNSLSLALICLAVFLGHLYPIFFKFQGGKGVATALGSLMVLCWPVGLALIGTWILTAILFRYSSLAALISALAAPFYTWYFSDWANTAIICMISLLLIFRHRQNIKNLWVRTEGKIKL